MICTRTAVALLALSATVAQAAEGFISMPSAHGPKATMDKLEAIVKAKGMKVFARIDHAKGAASVGKTLRPTELIIFGNPQGGTPFMQCAQTVGIDLPLKALVWQDAEGRTWLGYTDPVWIAARHGSGECAVVPVLAKALSGLANAATAP